MKTIFVLMDTLSRRYLPTYGSKETKADNITDFGKNSIVFDNHWIGSAPCIPARRDLMTGRLNFLERNWGGIEPFDRTLPEILRENNIYTHIISDHSHYFEMGGENYCQSFNTWEFERGQERDAWQCTANAPGIKNYYGQVDPHYQANRQIFRREEDYPTPRCFQRAIEWLDKNHGLDDFLLWLEVFDPHEPFDVPAHYLDMYDDDYQGPHYDWPEYKPVNVPPDALRHLQKRYAACITMNDVWFGKLMSKVRELGLDKDTRIILTSDHGAHLGEHGFLLKNYMPTYNEVAHIPLMVYEPGEAAGRISGLTQTPDLFPTILEGYNIESKYLINPIHGKSIYPLIRKREQSIHDSIIFGYFGRSVNWTDGRWTYLRAAATANNQPLNIYASVLTTLFQYYSPKYLENIADIEMGRFLSWTDFPVYKIPSRIITQADILQSFRVRGEFLGESLLFNIEEDYEQNHHVTDKTVENKLCQFLSADLRRFDSPLEQWDRLGLKNDTL